MSKLKIYSLVLTALFCILAAKDIHFENIDKNVLLVDNKDSTKNAEAVLHDYNANYRWSDTNYGIHFNYTTSKDLGSSNASWFTSKSNASVLVLLDQIINVEHGMKCTPSPESTNIVQFSDGKGTDVANYTPTRCIVPAQPVTDSVKKDVPNKHKQ